MARNNGQLTPEDDPASTSRAASLRAGVEESRDYARMDELESSPVDLEVEQQSPFLRAQKRISVRRGPLPKRAANRVKQVLIVVVVVAAVGGVAAGFYRYGARSWRFRIDSSDNIQIAGVQHVTRAQIMEVLGGDIGRNIFFVPLSERKKQVEEIPWVESATVMRFLPNRLKIEVRERTPVAFVRIGARISLIDGKGVVMEIPRGASKYSFPVITGMQEAEPLSTRAARMKIYAALLRELDSGGARYSQDLSEVDLADPEDVKITANDPAGQVLIHLGSSNFLDRYKIYVAHVQEWRQQFQKLDSVDLRYERQVIVNPDAASATPSAKVPAVVKAGAAAKPAGARTRHLPRRH